jgi:ribosomal protein L37AE/L43A
MADVARMEKKSCPVCGEVTWHNPPGGKAGVARCTKCAQPFGTGPKRERHVEAAKLVKRFK